MSSRKIYKCDRCGKEWEDVIENGYGNPPCHIDFDDLKSVDLCLDCYDAFYNTYNKWRNEIPEIK